MRPFPLNPCPGDEYKRRRYPDEVSEVDIASSLRWTKQSWLLLFSVALCKFCRVIFFNWSDNEYLRNGNSRLCEEAGLRKPRFFFVTTSSVTQSVTSATLCYKTDALALGQTAKPACRKKRSLFRTARLPKDMIQASHPAREDQVESPEDEPSSYMADGREGRFLLYWITTTTRSTTTIYSTTITISDVDCTVNSSLMEECGWFSCCVLC